MENYRNYFVDNWRSLKYILLPFVFFLVLPLYGQEDAEKKITLTVTPGIGAEGRLDFLGNDQLKSGFLVTSDDAKAKLHVASNYANIIGLTVETEASLNKAVSNQPALALGENAYIYAHILKAFGFDQNKFDLYVRAGRFELGFQNAQYFGNLAWIWTADVNPIARDKKLNFQLDMKVLNLLTLRYGVGFSNFNSTSNALDMGGSVLLNKSFNNHKILSSLAYVANITTNDGTNPDGTPRDVVTSATDFDELGFSFAYTGTFGRIQLMPYFNMRFKGLIHKPVYAYENPLFNWNAGMKFAYRDTANSYDLLSLGLTFEGLTRANENYTTKSGLVRKEYEMNQGLRGIQLRVWSDALKALMGSQYLSIWANARIGVWEPDTKIGGESVQREAFFTSWSIGVKQRIINTGAAVLVVSSEFGFENLSPFYVKNLGYVTADNFTTAIGNPFKAYLTLALTGYISHSIKF